MLNFNGVSISSIEMCKYCKLETKPDHNGKLFDNFTCKLGIKEINQLIHDSNRGGTTLQCPKDAGLEDDDKFKCCCKLEVNTNNERVEVRSDL